MIKGEDDVDWLDIAWAEWTDWCVFAKRISSNVEVPGSIFNLCRDIFVIICNNFS